MIVTFLFWYLVLGLVWSFLWHFHITAVYGLENPLEDKSANAVVIMYLVGALVFPVTLIKFMKEESKITHNVVIKKGKKD